MIAVFGVGTLQKDSAKFSSLKEKKIDFTYLKEIMAENKIQTLIYFIICITSSL